MWRLDAFPSCILRLTVDDMPQSGRAGGAPRRVKHLGSLGGKAGQCCTKTVGGAWCVSELLEEEGMELERLLITHVWQAGLGRLDQRAWVVQSQALFLTS